MLRQDRGARTPTPVRLFCLPFQDLLSSAPRKTKQKGVIARDSIIPLWTKLAQNLLVEQTQSYIAETKALILQHKPEAALARAAEYWALAAGKLSEVLADTTNAKRVLGDDNLMLADAAEIALLLQVGGSALQIQALMPTPVAALNESLLWDLRGVYDALIQTQPDAAPYVAVMVMNRLVRPWEALRLPMMISRQQNDTLISKTDMGLVGEILFGRLDRLGASILATRHPHFETDKLLDEVKTFADLSAAIVKEIEVRRDGEWGQRLLKDRAAVGNVMEGFMDRALRELIVALPMQKGTGKTADFTRSVDGEKRELALRYARLVVGSRNFAAAASFAAKQKDAYEALCAHLRRYNEDVVKEMRGTQADTALVESQFLYATELTALLFSEEEAELMRRRGKAAQSAAA
jgi:hypothetical protein